MHKLIVLVLGLAVLIYPSLIWAQGNHNGEIPPLEYRIEYLDSKGVTTVFEGGIDFVPFPGVPQPPYYDRVTFLPSEYWGDYSLYYVGDTLKFSVNIHNNSNRTYNHLRVVAINELLNIEGLEGEAFPGDSKTEWYVDSLRPDQTVHLEGEMEILPGVGSGIDQTHLQIYHSDNSGKAKKNPGNGRLILDAPQAGLWCPVDFGGSASTEE